MLGSLLFAGGYLAAGGASRDGTCTAPAEAFAALCEAYDKLKQQYVDKLDDTQLAEGAIRGLFEYGVKDPFSGYMSPDEYQRALGSLSGEFTGIGAEMAVKNTENPDDLAACPQLSDTCVLVVVAPLADSPAEAAGLQSGDVVLTVDGESVNGSTLQDQVAKVRGEAGTKVTLTLRRGERTFDLTITRAISRCTASARRARNNSARPLVRSSTTARPRSSSTCGTIPAATSVTLRRSRRSSSSQA